MSTIVFFLGAGASFDSGAPLVNKFVQKARSLAENGNVNPIDMEKIDALQNEASHRNLNPNNIEHLLQVAEENTWGNNGSNELLGYVERVIADTLEATISFPIQDGALKPSSSSYVELARLIGGIRNAAVPKNVILMTVNYDVCLDVAVLASGFRPYYCLNRNRGPYPIEISVLKLHGALNWRGCASRGHGYIDAKYHVDEFLKEQIRQKELALYDGERIHLHFRKIFPNDRCNKCDNFLLSPLIVPPIMDKTRYKDDMRILWDCARSNLRETSLIIIIGYSWSNADRHVNELLSEALNNSNSRLMVFDPDTEALERAQNILGIERKFNQVRTYRNTFEEAMTLIPEVIQ